MLRVPVFVHCSILLRLHFFHPVHPQSDTDISNTPAMKSLFLAMRFLLIQGLVTATVTGHSSDSGLLNPVAKRAELQEHTLELRRDSIEFSNAPIIASSNLTISSYGSYNLTADFSSHGHQDGFYFPTLKWLIEDAQGRKYVFPLDYACFIRQESKNHFCHTSSHGWKQEVLENWKDLAAGRTIQFDTHPGYQKNGSAKLVTRLGIVGAVLVVMAVVL